MSPMDVVRAVNNANLILPSGDVKIGPFDYTIFTNSQFRDDSRHQPHPAEDRRPLDGARVGDVGRAEDAHQIQNNIVDRRRPAVGLSAGDEAGRRHQHDRGGRRRQGSGRAGWSTCRKELKPKVVFDQSLFVKRAIETLLDEGGIGLALTALMVLVFLGSFRATVGGVPVDSAVGAGGDHRALHGRQLDQHDDPRRLRAGVLAADRQRGDRAREHLPPHGDGRVAGGGGREGRPGGRAGRAGRDADQLDRVLSGDVSLRREPLPVLGARAGRGAGAVRVVLRRDDGRAAVLRAS